MSKDNLFVRAEIFRTVPGNASAGPVATLTDEKLRELLGLLPSDDAAGDFSGAWISGYRIDLIRSDGSALTAKLDLRLMWWNSGQGDVPITPPLRDFLKKFLRDHAANSSHGTNEKGG